MDLDFDDMFGYWLVLSLNRRRCHLKIFTFSNNFITEKCVFLAVNASLRWLNNVLGPGFLAFYWSAGFGTFHQVLALASHWLEYCATFTPTPPEENNQYIANYS
jgi:hypothetical protein